MRRRLNSGVSVGWSPEVGAFRTPPAEGTLRRPALFLPVLLMVADIKPGTVLTKEGTVLPNSVRTEPFMPGWNLVPDADAAQTRVNVERDGWKFLPGREIIVSATARKLNEAIKKSLQRVVHEAERQNANAVEIAEFDATKLLLVYEVAARAFARQIQPMEGPRASNTSSARQ